MSTYEINHPGILTAALEVEVGPFSTDIVISSFSAAVSDAPSGGSCVVRVQNLTGASPTQSITSTIADGDSVGSLGTGTINVEAGSTLFVRIVSNAGAASFLRGHFEYAAAILGTVGGSDLCTVADVKTFLGITTATHDGLIQVIVSGISQAMQREMNREINRTTRDEYYSATGHWSTLVLDRAPVLEDSVALVVTEDGSAVADADFFVDTEAGIVYRIEGNWSAGTKHIRVQYESGYAAVPPELRLLAMERAAYEVKQTIARGDRIGEAQAVIGSSTVTYISRETWMASVRSDLKKWRRLV